MKTSALLGLWAWTCLQVSCAGRSAKDRKSQLAGLYKLYISENLDSTGRWQQDPWTKDATGYIVYDGLGHMAVQITPGGYRNFSWLNEEASINREKVRDKIDSMSMEELKAAVAEFSSSYVYVANYSIDDTADIVEHDRISSSLPVIWGTRVKRAFRFEGDTLVLRILDGNRRLKWIKQP